MENLNQVYLKAGCYSKVKVDKKILADIAFGYYICKEIDRDDAGQTVVVKNNSIMAVESYEGRIKTIIRGCNLASGKAVIIISNKLSQSDDKGYPLIDIPLLKCAVENKSRAVAFSESVAILDSKKCIDYADRNRLIFFAFNPYEILKHIHKGG